MDCDDLIGILVFILIDDIMPANSGPQGQKLCLYPFTSRTSLDLFIWKRFLTVLICCCVKMGTIGLVLSQGSGLIGEKSSGQLSCSGDFTRPMKSPARLCWVGHGRLNVRRVYFSFMVAILSHPLKERGNKNMRTFTKVQKRTLAFSTKLRF